MKLKYNINNVNIDDANNALNNGIYFMLLDSEETYQIYCSNMIIDTNYETIFYVLEQLELENVGTFDENMDGYYLIILFPINAKKISDILQNIDEILQLQYSDTQRILLRMYCGRFEYEELEDLLHDSSVKSLKKVKKMWTKHKNEYMQTLERKFHSKNEKNLNSIWFIEYSNEE